MNVPLRFLNVPQTLDYVLETFVRHRRVIIKLYAAPLITKVNATVIISNIKTSKPWTGVRCRNGRYVIACFIQKKVLSHVAKILTKSLV